MAARKVTTGLVVAMPPKTTQDEEGKERGVCEIIAGDVQFLGRAKDKTSADAPAGDEVSPDEIPS